MYTDVKNDDDDDTPLDHQLYSAPIQTPMQDPYHFLALRALTVIFVGPSYCCYIEKFSETNLIKF